MSRNISTLLVEDSIVYQKELISLLASVNIIPDTARSPFDAERLINNNKYGLLLCDTSLAGGPPGNKYGCEVGKLFLEVNPEGIVIGMSGNNQFAKYWEDIAHEFHEKPIKIEAIKEILNKYFP